MHLPFQHRCRRCQCSNHQFPPPSPHLPPRLQLVEAQLAGHRTAGLTTGWPLQAHSNRNGMAMSTRLTCSKAVGYLVYRSAVASPSEEHEGLCPSNAY